MYPYLKVLFICKNDASKSQIAKSYYDKFSCSTSNSLIAGIGDVSLMQSQILELEILQMVREEKINIIMEKIEPATEEMIKKFDRIIIFVKKEDCPDFLLKHPSIYFWEIEDPQGKSMERLRSIKDEIKLKTIDLLKIRW